MQIDPLKLLAFAYIIAFIVISIYCISGKHKYKIHHSNPKIKSKNNTSKTRHVVNYEDDDIMDILLDDDFD